jgi:hypothetical protein
MSTTAVLAEILQVVTGLAFGFACLYLPRRTLDGVAILITGVMFAIAVYLKAKL